MKFSFEVRKRNLMRRTATISSYRHGMGGRDRRSPAKVPTLPMIQLSNSSEAQQHPSTLRRV